MAAYKVTLEILNAAIAGLQSQKRRIDEQIVGLRQMLNGAGAEDTPAAQAAAGKRRQMSAAARKRIGDAQRKRWAASKRTGAQAENSHRQAKAQTERRWQESHLGSDEEEVGGKESGGETAPSHSVKGCRQKATARNSQILLFPPRGSW